MKIRYIYDGLWHDAIVPWQEFIRCCVTGRLGCMKVKAIMRDGSWTAFDCKERLWKLV